MRNLNGNLINDDEALIPLDNRGTLYSDGVFETIRCRDGKPLLFEPHYFRLMSGMRILRMEIPRKFTPEFLETEITSLLKANDLNKAARVRLNVWRSSGGYYTPTSDTVEYGIIATAIKNYYPETSSAAVELFKDHYLTTGLLGNIKSTSKSINVLAGIYGKENSYDDMLLLNHNKMIVESISGNLFIVKDNQVKTPPLTDGCINGIMREQIINQIKKMLDYSIVEETVTPFELQRADEIFTTNMIYGVKSIKKFRKKSYTSNLAVELLDFLNKQFN